MELFEQNSFLIIYYLVFTDVFLLHYNLFIFTWWHFCWQ